MSWYTFMFRGVVKLFQRMPCHAFICFALCIFKNYLRRNSEHVDLMSIMQNLIKVLNENSWRVKMLPAHNYMASSHNGLIEITNNVSKTIVKSCSGIDAICNRTRECLHDVQYLRCLQLKTRHQK